MLTVTITTSERVVLHTQRTSDMMSGIALARRALVHTLSYLPEDLFVYVVNTDPTADEVGLQAYPGDWTCVGVVGWSKLLRLAAPIREALGVLDRVFRINTPDQLVAVLRTDPDAGLPPLTV